MKAFTGAEDGPIALLKAVSAAVKRRLLPLVLCILLSAGLAFLYARSLPPVYTASATLILEPPRQFSSVQGVAGSDNSLDLNRVDSELQVIRAERLQRLVFDDLGLIDNPEFKPDLSDDPAALETVAPADPVAAQIAQDRARETAFGKFQSQFGARRIGQSYVLEISYSSADPGLAARIANAGASAYLLQSVRFKEAAAGGGSEFVQGRLDSLTNQVEAAAAAVRAGTLPEIQIPDADARIIGAAIPPLSPSAPRVKLMTALGMVAGMMAGLFAIAIGAALDRRVADGRKLAAESDVAQLALIPLVRGVSAAQMEVLAISAPGSAFALAVRDLRTSIDLAFGPEFVGQNRCIALASWRRGAGCSTLCMNLTHALHRADHTAIAVDADTRAGREGLTWRYRNEQIDIPAEGPAFLTANGVPLVPARALGAVSDTFGDTRDPGTSELFRQLRAWDNTVIDLPPLSESADARALARQADAVIIVVTRNSLIDEVLAADQQLKDSGARVIGIVINDTVSAAAPSVLARMFRRRSPDVFDAATAEFYPRSEDIQPSSAGPDTVVPTWRSRR